MNEEEIMQGINRTIAFMKEELNAEHSCFTIKELWSLQGLLDLYNKEKEKNISLEQEREYLNCIIESDEDNYIHKDKIKAKIEELEKEYKQFSDWDREDDCMIAREEIDILEELLEESE